MKKELISLFLLISFFQCMGQSSEIKPRQFSIGAGVGYGSLQDRYDDGNYSYTYWRNKLRPFIFNLRYSWNNDKNLAPFFNVQFTHYPYLVGDVALTLPMLFLTGGSKFMLARQEKIFITASGGWGLIDKTYGFVLGPSINYNLFHHLGLELQITYARTYSKHFKEYQMVDCRMLLIYYF